MMSGTKCSFKSILLLSYWCQSNSLSVFKFGSGASVLFVRVWKINIFLKKHLKVWKKKGLPTEVMVKQKSVLYCFWRFTE